MCAAFWQCLDGAFEMNKQTNDRDTNLLASSGSACSSTFANGFSNYWSYWCQLVRFHAQLAVIEASAENRQYSELHGI